MDAESIAYAFLIILAGLAVVVGIFVAVALYHIMKGVRRLRRVFECDDFGSEFQEFKAFKSAPGWKRSLFFYAALYLITRFFKRRF